MDNLFSTNLLTDAAIPFLADVETSRFRLSVAAHAEQGARKAMEDSLSINLHQETGTLVCGVYDGH